MPLVITVAPGEDDEAKKRRKMLQEALEMDRARDHRGRERGQGRARGQGQACGRLGR
jgi:hypothetical protein